MSDKNKYCRDYDIYEAIQRESSFYLACLRNGIRTIKALETRKARFFNPALDADGFPRWNSKWFL